LGVAVIELGKVGHKGSEKGLEKEGKQAGLVAMGMEVDLEWTQSGQWLVIVEEGMAATTRCIITMVEAGWAMAI